MKRRILSVVLCVVMMLALAAPALAVTPRANPESKQYTYGGKTYIATLSLEYSSLNGGRSVARSGGTYIEVTLSNVSVTFDTQSYGYVTASGGGKSQWFGENTSVIRSGFVSCPYGSSQALGYTYMSGNATFKPGNSNVTVYAYTN